MVLTCPEGRFLSTSYKFRVKGLRGSRFQVLLVSQLRARGFARGLRLENVDP